MCVLLSWIRINEKNVSVFFIQYKRDLWKLQDKSIHYTYYWQNIYTTKIGKSKTSKYFQYAKSSIIKCRISNFESHKTNYVRLISLYYAMKSEPWQYCNKYVYYAAAVRRSTRVFTYVFSPSIRNTYIHVIIFIALIYHKLFAFDNSYQSYVKINLTGFAKTDVYIVITILP